MTIAMLLKNTLDAAAHHRIAMSFSASDLRFMRIAMELAGRGHYTTAPNPWSVASSSMPRSRSLAKGGTRPMVDPTQKSKHSNPSQRRTPRNCPKARGMSP